jgi:hypothetical protein
MLWIEFESEGQLEISVVKAVLSSLAKLLSPFPICAYDRGECNVGLLVHDGILPGTGEEDVASQDLVREEKSRGNNDGSSNSSLDFLSDSTDISTSTDMRADLIPVPESFHNEANSVTNDINFTSSSNGGGMNPDGSAQGHQAGMNSNGNSGMANQNGNHRGNHDAGDDNDDDDGNNEDVVRAPSPKGIPEFDTFAGTTHLRLDKLRQDLDISFDLRIQPTRRFGVADCVISIDNCIVRAGDMYSNPTADDWQDPQLPCYVSRRTMITFSPSGNCRVAKNAYPLWPNYEEKNTVNIGKRVEGNFEASANPKAVFKIGSSKNQIVDQIPTTLAIRPRKIGSGSRRDFRWDYTVTSQAETYLELSSDHPPMHRATFPVEIDSRDVPGRANFGPTGLNRPLFGPPKTA